MKNYYLLSNGRIRREQNTLSIETEQGGKRFLPIEDIESIFAFGEVDLNSKFLVYLAQNHIPMHFFNYYGFYSGSYYPREYLHSGHLLVHQVEHYLKPDQRMELAREFVRGAAHSIERTTAYYASRRKNEEEPQGDIIPSDTLTSNMPTDEQEEAEIDSTARFDQTDVIDEFESRLIIEDDLPASLSEIIIGMKELAKRIGGQLDPNSLRGIEGKIREQYYQSWGIILRGEWEFARRVRRPPDNEVNALISFGNSVLYTVCLSEIYRTQLNPTISYLHEPGSRRFSLALDISEIFKPIIVDRAIFRLLNTEQLKRSHFDTTLNGCYLAEEGRRLFLGALEERLSTTIYHRRLGRHVTYRRLIRLECYKLIRHLTGVESYRAFRAWW